jgi:hypothetical protein
MITIEKHPSSVIFAGNPILFNVISDALYAAAGVKAYCELKFTDIDQTLGHSFQLSFMNQVFDFIIANDNNDLGLSIPPAAGGDTPTTWCAKVGTAMSENYFLHTNYDIVISNTVPSILFTAKNPGAFYSMTFTNVNVTGIIQYHQITGVDSQLYPGFGILAQILDENDDIIGEDLRPPDSNGRVQFDVSEYLNSFLEGFIPPHFTIPVNANKTSSFENGIKKFRMAFAEKYIGVSKRLHIDDFHYAVMGGLSRETLSWWNEQVSGFFDDVNNKKRFLTWAPRQKNTTIDQLERLYFLVSDPAIISLTPSIQVMFTDGTNQTITLNAVSLPNFGVIELQVGYTDLNLSNIQPAKTVQGWRVWMSNSSGIVSEIFTFNLDTRTREYDRQFIFRNSFGWYDVALFKGLIESDLEYVYNQGNIILEDIETVYNSPDKNFQTTEQQTFIGTTGWFSKDYLEWMRDMFRSTEIYEIINGRCYSVIITVQKVLKSKDGNDNLQYNIEYRRSYQDIFYSPIPDDGSNNGGDDPVPFTADTTYISADSTEQTSDQTQL